MWFVAIILFQRLIINIASGSQYFVAVTD